MQNSKDVIKSGVAMVFISYVVGAVRSVLVNGVGREMRFESFIKRSVLCGIWDTRYTLFCKHPHYP